ncbi:MAG: phage tail protein [Anaerolineae bacterium]|nr:phage tail protein [Anaerolineae bacterium]
MANDRLATDALRQTAVPAFRFVVEIGGTPQAAFTECTLPAIEWEMEEVKEGGLNTYTHMLPGRRKGAKMTLKNGVGSGELYDWCLKQMGETFERKQVTVSLMNSMKKKVMSWTLAGAYPLKWTGPQLKSSDNSVAIQSLELACDEVTVATG